jgi:hypothetical protein
MQERSVSLVSSPAKSFLWLAPKLIADFPSPDILRNGYICSKIIKPIGAIETIETNKKSPMLFGATPEKGTPAFADR